MEDGGGVWPKTEASAWWHWAFNASTKVVSGTRLLSAHGGHERLPLTVATGGLGRDGEGLTQLQVGLLLEQGRGGGVGLMGRLGQQDQGSVDVAAGLLGQCGPGVAAGAQEGTQPDHHDGSGGQTPELGRERAGPHPSQLPDESSR